MVNSRSVSISTLNVSIKAIKVDNKSMSIALFKQLPVKSLFTYNGKLNEEFTVWGYVLHRVAGEGNRWVIVTFKDELFRCNFDEGMSIELCRTNLEYWPFNSTEDKTKAEIQLKCAISRKNVTDSILKTHEQLFISV